MLSKRKKYVTRVFDLYPLKIKSIIKINNLEEKGIRNRRRLEKSNHNKLIYLKNG